MRVLQMSHDRVGGEEMIINSIFMTADNSFLQSPEKFLNTKTIYDEREITTNVYRKLTKLPVIVDNQNAKAL